MEQRKVIKVQFRQKKSSRAGAYKVFTNLRIPDQRHPKQLHLCYIADHTTLTEHDKAKIQTAARKKWPLPGGSDLSIDWEDAEHKWAKKGTKRSPIDRDAALKELFEWLENEKKIDVLFAIRKIGSKWLALEVRRGMSLHDSEELDDWWNYEEVPRLFLAYKRYTANHSKDAAGNPVVFSPEGFLSYLKGNIRHKYSVVDFVRKKRTAPAFEDLSAFENVLSSDDV